MRRRWGRVTAVMVILLLGIMILLVIIVEPRIERTIAAGQSTYNIKDIQADLRYERRIKLIREELDKANKGEYTTMFLSMYPIDSYDMWYISHWRGLDVYKMEMTMENGRELAGALEYLQEQKIIPETILLGLDPECVEAEYPLADTLLQTVRENSGTAYEILLVNPSMAYWREKEEAEWQAVIDKYTEAAALLTQEENVKVFYACDREWLVCNESNYEEEKMPAEDVATTLLAYYTRGEYQLTGENYREHMARTRELIADWRRDDRKAAGVQDRMLVFIGDSTFGNFDGSLAITGVVEAFTGARVLNCGYGGMAAADGSLDTPDLSELIHAIRREDSSAIRGENNAPAVVTAQELKRSLGQGEKAIIFILFGINDYIEGFPIRKEDLFATDTYEGALRTAIEDLQTMFPLAELVLMSPNYIYYNHCGTDPVGEGKYVFSDYVEAMLGIAEEYRLTVIDNYGGLGIDSDNVMAYLQDEIHLNEAGRFAAGMRVLEQLQESGFGGQ